MVQGTTFAWTERQLLIYSPTLAQSSYHGLQKRLKSATDKLLRLTPEPGRGKRQFHELAPLQKAAQAILTRYRVTEFLQMTYQQHIQEKHIRTYKGRPARVETIVRYHLSVARDETAIKDAYRRMGWRLYVTNAPLTRLSLQQAVRVYRGGVATISNPFAMLRHYPHFKTVFCNC